MNHINLTPKEAAARLRTSAQVLSNWRIKGIGPKYIKMGRKVLYPVAQLEIWEDSRLRQNTAA